MSRYKGICFALEDDNVVEPVEVETPVIPAEVVEDVAEVEEIADDSNEMHEAAETAGEDLETLEDVRDVLADSVEAGEGVDQPAAAIAEIAVESLCRRLGMRKVELIPAMESFGSKNSRVAATRIAVEGLGETIKNGWKKLMEWLKKAWETIVAFFKKMFDANLKLKKAAEDLKGKVATLAGDAKAKEAEIENKSLAAAFGAKDAATTVKGLVELTKNASGVFESMVKDVQELDKVAAKFGTGGKVVITSADSVGIVESFEKAVAGVPGAEKKRTGDATVIEIAGYKIGWAGSIKEGIAGFNLIWEKLPEAKTKVPTLNKGQMEAAVAEVIALCDETAAYKEVYSKAEKINKISMDTVEKVLKGLEKLAKVGAKDGKSESGEALIETRKRLMKSNGLASSFGSKLPSINVSTGKAALEYVGVSLKQYKAD